MPHCEPRFGPSPGLGFLGTASAARGRAELELQAGGTCGGLCQLAEWVRASGYLRGALHMHPADVHVPQNQTDVPKSLVLQTMRLTANALREKPLQKWIFLFPFSLCIPGVRTWDLKALSLPRLSQRSAGSTAML